MPFYFKIKMLLLLVDAEKDSWEEAKVDNLLTTTNSQLVGD
jgi:hypothetical protein